jgi:hypothetical protein
LEDRVFDLVNGGLRKGRDVADGGTISEILIVFSPAVFLEVSLKEAASSEVGKPPLFPIFLVEDVLGMPQVIDAGLASISPEDSHLDSLLYQRGKEAEDLDDGQKDAEIKPILPLATVISSEEPTHGEMGHRLESDCLDPEDSGDRDDANE